MTITMLSYNTITWNVPQRCLSGITTSRNVPCNTTTLRSAQGRWGAKRHETLKTTTATTIQNHPKSPKPDPPKPPKSHPIRSDHPFLRFVVWSAVHPMESAVDPMGGAGPAAGGRWERPPSDRQPAPPSDRQTTRRRNGSYWVRFGWFGVVWGGFGWDGFGSFLGDFRLTLR